MHRRLIPGECQVWWARPSDVGSRLPDLHESLDQAERDRAARYIRSEDRARSVVAHALVRLVLGAQLGVRPGDLRFDTRCRRCGAGHGKPRLEIAGPEFSISHSGDRVAVALTDGAPVGVDVERLEMKVDVDVLVALALSPEERQAHAGMASADRTAALLSLWVRKEALLKATGHGLAIPPASVTLVVSEQRPRLLRWAGMDMDPASVRLLDLRPGPGYVACVAVIGGPEPVVRELDARALLAGSGSGHRARFATDMAPLVLRSTALGR